MTPVKIGHGRELCVDVEPDAVWVSDAASHSVTRVDPKTNAVVATIKVDGSPADGTRGPDGLIWIPNQGVGTISRIDPATNALVDTVTVGGYMFVVRSGFGSLWAGDFTGTTIRRIQP
jgi:YVTN family beta-propeller protein